jgi:long-chain acyl-CoA synthetase
VTLISPAVTPIPLVCSLREHILLHPDRPAFLTEAGAVSLERFGRMISSTAARLRCENPSPGDRILLCGPNGVAWAAAYFAVHAVGAVVVPLDFDAPEEAWRQRIADAQPRMAFTAKEPPVPIAFVPLESVEEGNARATEAIGDKTCSLSHDFSRLPPPSPSVSPPLDPVCRPDDLADLLFTTGTTGNKKGVALTHAQIAHAALNINAFIGNRPGDVEVVPIPLSHSFGLGRLRCMARAGTTLVLEAGLRNAPKVLQRVLDLKAAGFASVPAGFELILRMTKDRLGDAKEHLRYVEIGSAPMRSETKRKLMELLPNTRICHHYGLTEASRATFIEYHSDRDKLDSIGRPSPNVEIAIRDADGRNLPQGQNGELVVHGGMVMREYWRMPDRTREVLDNGWLRTGDWGRLDPDGYLFLAGRRSDLINVGGLKVCPEEVERQLDAHPAVAESACVGAPDPRGLTGECVKAFFVQREPVADRELVAWLRPRLEEYKIPTFWERVEQIPKTASGKIQRHLLR